MASDACVAGSPGGHSNKCFSKNFLPSVMLFMSCSSSRIGASPFFLVVGLFIVGRAPGEATGLSAWFLPFFPFVGGILVGYIWGFF